MYAVARKNEEDLKHDTSVKILKNWSRSVKTKSLFKAMQFWSEFFNLSDRQLSTQ